jgi:hypothetical protein
MWRLLESLLEVIKPVRGKGDKLLACVLTLSKINMPKVNKSNLKPAQIKAVARNTLLLCAYSSNLG